MAKHKKIEKKKKPTTAKRKKKSTSPKKEKSSFSFLKFSFLCFIWATVGLIGLVAWYGHDLPDISKTFTETRTPTIYFHANHSHSPFASYGKLYGGKVDFKSLPPHLIQAVISIEDRRFYSHFGVDPLSITRAALHNYFNRGSVQGGSTITQQLAKILFLSPERTFKRKFQELLLSFWLEARFSKEQILTIYLNRIYLGSGCYGVDAASRKYFRKPVQKISLYEAAMIAGMIKAPSVLNPHNNIRKSRQRAHVVLDTMVRTGYITQKQKRLAKRRHSYIPPSSLSTGSYKYFSDWAYKNIKNQLSAVNDDIKIETTFDLDLQKKSEQIIKKYFSSLDQPTPQIALLALSHNGAVKAMIGGKDYQKSQFNRSTQAKRQPGSLFKPFVYLAAIEKGFTPDTIVNDHKITINGWSPKNANNRYYGKVTLREAFARSLNTVAVETGQKVKTKNVIRTAKKLGITSILKNKPSLALGTSEVSLLEMVSAYTAFANGGYPVIPYGIKTIKAKSSGDVIYKRSSSGFGKQIKQKHLNHMQDLLSSSLQWGTSKKAKISGFSGGKTGTSQSNRDAWFIGYTDDLVIGIWIGYDNEKSMKNISGGTLPTKIWKDIIR